MQSLEVLKKWANRFIIQWHSQQNGSEFNLAGAVRRRNVRKRSQNDSMAKRIPDVDLRHAM
jgi:hypothetical protein